MKTRNSQSSHESNSQSATVDRRALTDRISEIEIVLGEIGFYISDLGEITGEYKPVGFAWKPALFGAILLLPQISWFTCIGSMFLLFGFRGPIDELFHQRRIEPHRLKLKELELEL